MNTTLIQNRIYEIRGQKVMLDFDLAEIYQVETRVMNQAVKRNAERFPPDFLFRLTADEWKQLSSSQIVMMDKSPKNRTGKYLPFAFTEHGITMLANVLRSKRAIEMSIVVVRAFIAMRQALLQQSELAARLEQLSTTVGKHSSQLKAIYEAIENLLKIKMLEKAWEERERIGFKKE